MKSIEFKFLPQPWRAAAVLYILMKYLAIEINGFVGIYNNSDELGGLIDHSIDFKVLGTVCDDKEFGDRCTTDCPAYRYGVCKAEIIKDSQGNLWHVI